MYHWYSRMLPALTALLLGYIVPSVALPQSNITNASPTPEVPQVACKTVAACSMGRAVH